MRTTEITLYGFDELSPSAQEKAIENLSKINVADNWDKDILKEIVDLGALNVTYELLTDSYCSIDFTEMLSDKVPVGIPLYDEIAKYIIENHKEDSGIHVIAKTFLNTANQIVVTSDKNSLVHLKIEAWEQTFKETLESYYIAKLKEEYNLRISKTEIIKTIDTDEFKFTIDGKLYESIE
jgi:hypothetical protein